MEALIPGPPAAVFEVRSGRKPAPGGTEDQTEHGTMKPHRDGTRSTSLSPFVDVGIWLIALTATGLTVWYSLGPRPPDHGSDKELHAMAYLIDTFAILLAVVWRPGRQPRRFDAWALPAAMAMLVLGGLIEITQGGFTDRDAQFGDWIADGLGIGLALLLFTALRWVHRRRRR
jgi:VanZ family protein